MMGHHKKHEAGLGQVQDLRNRHEADRDPVRDHLKGHLKKHEVGLDQVRDPRNWHEADLDRAPDHPKDHHKRLEADRDLDPGRQQQQEAGKFFYKISYYTATVA